MLRYIRDQAIGIANANGKPALDLAVIAGDQLSKVEKLERQPCIQASGVELTKKTCLIIAIGKMGSKVFEDTGTDISWLLGRRRI